MITMKNNENNGVCIKDFRILIVYQKSLNMVREINEITKQFPNEEKYKITDQMMRAVTSIGANIAEGVGQEYKAKTISFCNIALGSANEMRHWIAVAEIKEYISGDKFNDLEEKFSEICRMLIGYIKMLKKEL